ncbi:MAG TPA: ROK family transcriptional regulator [Solirubrobacteraceae bacterium]|nr:ROK family transcriptional regulator [Solirubrobacteraceae bacterium]
MPPAPVPTPATGNGAGSLLRLIRAGDAATRADLARALGLSRSTVAQRVEALLASGLIYETAERASTGGRPPTRLAFNADAGVVLVADLGATHSRLAVSDLSGTPLLELPLELDIAGEPSAVLERVDDAFRELRADARWSGRPVRGIGIGVPAPVAFATGQPVSPPIMPAWDGFAIPRWFADRYDAPVLVDNDVNIMALGEHRAHWRETEHFLFIKAGTGIGCGIIAGGAIHRGAQGAAGDIGHIRATYDEEVLCGCGNVNCLEAVAGGRALARLLSRRGLDARNSRDVVRLVRAGEPEAVVAVREAGRALGEVLAASVNLFNPSVIVIGGDLADAHEQLLAGIREVIFQRSPPLATQNLRTAPSRLGDRAGVTGAAIMVVEHVLAPDAVDRAIQAAAA